MTRVLVVDDEDMLRALLAEEVEDMGFEVTQACNGREALAAAAAAMPDLVLCDNAMPMMTGLEFVAALRKTYGPAAAPVIVVSAFNSEADIAAAAAAGAVAYCSKPVDFDALDALMRKALADAG